MTSNTAIELEAALVDLSRLYPDLRFGQLMEMVALLAAGESPGNPSDIEDAALLRTALSHGSKRARQLGSEVACVSTSVSPARLDLLHRLRELRRRYPDWRFGQLASQVAEWSDVSLYDAEDEQLLTAARRHLV
jgi:hypothetical protein